MEQMAPVGPIYQAGTLSGNPIAVTAGIATLNSLTYELYRDLEGKATRLAEGLSEATRQAGVKATLNRVGSMMTGFFTDTDVVDYETAKSSDTARFGRYFRGMLERGVYLAPSQFEAAFVSAAHSPEDIDATITAANEVLRELE